MVTTDNTETKYYMGNISNVNVANWDTYPSGNYGFGKGLIDTNSRDIDYIYGSGIKYFSFVYGYLDIPNIDSDSNVLIVDSVSYNLTNGVYKTY